MKIKGKLTINMGVYEDFRPEIEITVPDGLENQMLVQYLHSTYHGLFYPEKAEKEVPAGTPIPKFDYTDRSKLSEDQYQGFGTPTHKFKKVGGETKKIDLRGEPVCRSCGGTSSNLSPLVAGYHPECRKREQYKLKEL